MWHWVTVTDTPNRDTQAFAVCCSTFKLHQFRSKTIIMVWGKEMAKNVKNDIENWWVTIKESYLVVLVQMNYHKKMRNTMWL